MASEASGAKRARPQSAPVKTLGRLPWEKDAPKEVPKEVEEATAEQRSFLMSIGAIGQSMNDLLSCGCASARKGSKQADVMKSHLPGAGSERA